MVQVASHPTPQELEAFALGRLSDDLFCVVENHVSSCGDCEAIVSGVAGDAFTTLLQSTQALSDTPEPVAGEASTIDSGALGGGTGSCAAADAEHVDIPSMLANHPRYRPVRQLGSGGMGTVWLAEHRVMGRQVAVKVIRPEFVAKAGAIERFRRETQTAAMLTHPNIVTAFDAERVGDTHLLAMEYINGVSLADEVRSRGPLPVAEACDAVRQAALGLQRAHECGLVHRDVKPQNLMRTADGTVKILDFGLAVLGDMNRADRGLTGTGVVMGTPDYVAPEQAEDPRTADVRSDIYSLGCTLYYFLTGRVPFPGDSVLRKLDAHRHSAPEPVRKRRPQVPEALATIVARMMAKKPADRYQTPAEVAQALEALTKIARPAPRRRWLVAAAALFAGMLLAGGVVYRIETDKGELVITTETDDVDVIIKEGGRIVRVIDMKTDKQITLTLRSGVYELELKGAPEGLKLTVEKATLTRGDTVLARVERVAKGSVAGIRRPDGPADGKEVDKPRFLARIIEPQLFFHHQWTRFSSDGTLISFAAPPWEAKTKVIRVFQADSGKLVRGFSDVDSLATGANITPDKKQLLTCHLDGTFRLWNLETGSQRQAKQFARARGDTALWDFSPDGKHVATAEAVEPGIRHFRVWEYETGRERVTAIPLAPDSWQHFCRFTPDGKCLVTLDTCDVAATDGWSQIRLHDLASGKWAKTVKVQGWIGPPAGFRDDGRQVGVGRYRSEDGWGFEFFDLASGKSAGYIASGIREVDHLAMTPDGRFGIVLAKGDRAVRFFDLSTGKEVHRLTDVREGGERILISPDSRRMAIGLLGRVSLFRLPDPPAAKGKP
ncbi:MAG: serine/threonine-protein kinase [Gemmataceae bacterium]|mgnify:CR=1 FL=1